MKVLIVTIVDNINYGTYLQAFATWWTIKQMGHEPIILDYERPYISPINVSKQYLHDKTKGFFSKIVYAAVYPLLFNYMKWNVKRFLKQRAILTKKYCNIKKIVGEQINADIYLTGSDQVWNSDYNKGIDKIFFLDFAKNGFKCSFSSSVGINSFSENDIPVIKNLLLQYDRISVRESFGVEVLKNIGIGNIEQLVDPTFLLTKSVWLSMCATNSFVKKEPYLLIYSVEKDRTNTILKIAKEIAEYKQLKTYWVCPTIKFRKKLGVDRVYCLANVETFLNLVANADFMIVSSFHGTAFSINFNKQFITVSPSKYNSRVMSLLNLVGLKDRYIEGDQFVFENFKDIEYDKINPILEQQRTKATTYLTNIFKGNHHE